MSKLSVITTPSYSAASAGTCAREGGAPVCACEPTLTRRAAALRFTPRTSSEPRSSSGTLSAARFKLSATSSSDLANLLIPNLCAFSTSITARLRALSESAIARSS